ncbi:mRNA decay activator protein ZFP36 [Dunckerocampus dactyliophorus]|uniref:mRNA decay activator protein ZFP36 n=1 Tax=Dunckerocampus dactyliophorus TaxID=161453 RepID=UPI0024064F2B|nr:mRNA decay activator protein ZFP36 [Dunckerocampus dactyliophorus]
MSEMHDDIFTKNLLNLALDDALLTRQSQLSVPGQGRLNRSASFFSSPSPPASSNLSFSTEHINNDDNSSSLWSSNIWSQAPSLQTKTSALQARSMSLTESSISLLSSFGQLKNLEAFPSGPATTVAPPPGFPPASNLPAQVAPMLSSNRYKTELCRGFQETGSCKYGSKCQFAHGEAELRGMYRHPKYKTEPCRTFYNFGYCPYGSRCHFIHEEKISGGQLTSAKFQNQRQQTPATTSGQNPRHQLRQSVSFAGFLGSSRTSPPPSFPASFTDPNLGFSRAPSVSPPPADLISPVFGDSLSREVAAFQFGTHQTRASSGDIHNIPLIVEPKASRCLCGHSNDFSTLHGNSGRGFAKIVDGNQQDSSALFAGTSHSGLMKHASLQRFSSEDSLEDSYSSSSGGSSGTESPTFDGSSNKRLTVFERLSLSD